MKNVIAIDGPSGAGKSTVARALGAELHLDVLDTGAMYRAATIAALRGGADLSREAEVSNVVRGTTVTAEGGRVTLDGTDVTDDVRTPEVTAAVSAVAANPAVREILVSAQRAWLASRHAGIVEGRDIGTVVFPDAAVKIYLTASDEERARRRSADEHAAQRSSSVSAERQRLAERDRLDSTRSTSPLARAADALEIDSTHTSVGEIVSTVARLFRERTSPTRGGGDTGGGEGPG
ncbi:MAG: (d)CMP kinase [Acidimicrobiia bacterium]